MGATTASGTVSVRNHGSARRVENRHRRVVGDLPKVRIEPADRTERPRNGETDHIIGQRAKGGDGLRGADRDRHHDSIGVGSSQRFETRSDGRTRGDTVVDDNDGFSGELRLRAVATVAGGLLSGSLCFPLALPLEVLLVGTGAMESRRVPPDTPVAGDGTESQFRVVRGTDLGGDDNVQWDAEGVGDDPTQRKPAARDRQHDIRLDPLIPEGVGELSARIGSIGKSERVAHGRTEWPHQPIGYDAMWSVCRPVGYPTMSGLRHRRHHHRNNDATSSVRTEIDRDSRRSVLHHTQELVMVVPEAAFFK